MYEKLAKTNIFFFFEDISVKNQGFGCGFEKNSNLF